jgi:hypothetical protein
LEQFKIRRDGIAFVLPAIALHVGDQFAADGNRR